MDFNVRQGEMGQEGECGALALVFLVCDASDSSRYVVKKCGVTRRLPLMDLTSGWIPEGSKCRFRVAKQ